MARCKPARRLRSDRRVAWAWGYMRDNSGGSCLNFDWPLPLPRFLPRSDEVNGQTNAIMNVAAQLIEATR
jgi:hypothetical protein